jgi:hypothetical protein
MSMFKSFFIAGALAAATAAAASPAHLTDARYLAAARCQVLLGSSALGPVSSQAIDAVMRSEDRVHSIQAYNRAVEARETARNDLRHAGVYGRQELAAERNGACQALVPAQTVAAAR